MYKVSVAPGSHLNVTWGEHASLPRPIPKPEELGPVPGSRPRKLQWNNSEPQLGLITQDIVGATSQRFIGEVLYNIFCLTRRGRFWGGLGRTSTVTGTNEENTDN